jgi:hypothetical protein
MNTIRISIQGQVTGWLLLFLIIAFSDGNAAKDIILNTTGRNSTIVLKNTYSSLQVSNSISSFNTRFLNTDKGEFVELFLDSYSKTNKAGTPQLPVLSKLIEVPAGSTPEVKVISYDLKEYKLADFGITQKILPAQSPQSKSDKQVKPLEFNQQVYQTNSFCGEARARVEIAGYLRGVQLANFILSPIEYNPVTNTIRVYDNLVVEIIFTGAAKMKSSDSKAKAQSPYYKSVFSNVLSYQQTENKSEENPGVPEKYVVVSDPMFHDALQPFVKWKTKRGFKVIEAYTNNPDVGNSLNSIKAYLQNLYTSSSSTDPAPAFVLFVGDVARIPAYNCGDHVSDLYYCEYTGDYLPEVFYGRFSANTVEELLPQVNKTLQYEQYLMPDPSYLAEVVLAAGADATHQARWGNGMVNYGTSVYFNQAHNLVSHTYFQPEPAGGNYSGSIQADISKGVSFAGYSAHGNPEGWADPLFSIAEIPALRNAGKYGLIVGNACQTNAYDRNSFGEALLRAENKGALGYIGASGLSYWDEDYWWGVGAGSVVANPSFENTGPGAYDRIFHDHGEPRSEWYSTMGQMVFAGNLAVQESNSELKKYYWESYCLMGDPSTMIYFGVPTALPAAYSHLLPLGTSTFEVRTEPFASVAVSKNNILHGVACADENGLALVSLNPLTEPGYANIVITKQNRQPFTDSVKVASPEGPYLVLRNFKINDNMGNNNHFPDYGEPLSINILFDNIGKAGAQKAVSKLRTTDNYFTVTSDTYTWSSIPACSSASATNAFTLMVSGDVPDKHTASFVITTQTESESYRSEFSVTAYAPELLNGTIAIDDHTAGNGNRRIDAGETIFVTVPTTNTGHSTSGEVSTRLFVFEDNESSFSKELNLGKQVPGATGNSAFSFMVSPDTAPGSILSLFVTATAGSYNSVSNLSLPVGAQEEHFETGLMKYYWQFRGIKPWEISSSAKQDDVFSTKSGVISHSEKSEMYLEGQFLFNDSISFYLKVSSENGYDYLKFYIDNSEVGRWSGTKDWGKVSFPVSAGYHRLRWVYEKDEATSAGLDAAWIDNIQFPAFSGVSAGPVSVKMIAVPATICAGEQSQLFMFAPGIISANRYQWSPTATLNNAGIFNPLAAPDETTTYSINVSGKSFSASGNITVNVEQTPASPVISVSENHLVSSATQGNQWYNSQGPLHGATGQTFFPTTTDTYYVISKFKSCSSEASNKITFGFAGVANPVKNSLSVYPNPFTNILAVEYTTKSAGLIKIVLYNSLGNEIFVIEKGNKSAGNHKAIFNGSQIASGIYTCKLFSSEGVKIVKVIKE